MDGTTQSMFESTSESNTDGTEIPWPLSVQIILALIVGSTSLLTVIGNAIIIHAYFTTRALRTYTNYYILNLAITDLIGGLFPMPMYGSYWILGYWPLSISMCDFYLWVNHTTITATSYAVLIIAIDRYRSVVHPITHFRQRTRKFALLWISACYGISLLVWTPVIFIWPAAGGRSFPPNICQPEYTNSLGFAAFAQLALFWIPLVVMAVLYAKVYKVYKQRMGNKTTQKRNAQTSDLGTSLSSSKSSPVTIVSQDASSTPEGENTSRSDTDRQDIESPRVKKENNTAVRTLSFIFIVYLASGVPWAVLVIIFKMCPECIPLALYQTSVYVVRISSLLNPICYAAANKLFKEAFKRVLCFWRRNR